MSRLRLDRPAARRTVWILFQRACAVWAALLAATACDVAVIRPLDPVTGKAILEEGPSTRDPAEFARSTWTTELPSAFDARSVDVAVLREALAQDPEEAARARGHREPGRPPSFLVFGTGRVVAVDTTSRAGFVVVDLVPPDGIPDVHIQTGPVIRGTALRDGLPFVSFDQFENQVAHAAVSRELHRLVVDSVLAPLHGMRLAGRTLFFRGALTFEPGSPLVVTPVRLRVEE